MHESMLSTATRHAPRTSPMVALARELGAASRTSVARLRPAESDVRGMPSTRSKTVGAVRQVRGGAEVGFWVVCWVARGGARQLSQTGTTCFQQRHYARPTGDSKHSNANTRGEFHTSCISRAATGSIWTRKGDHQRATPTRRTQKTQQSFASKTRRALHATAGSLATQ